MMRETADRTGEHLSGRYREAINKEMTESLEKIAEEHIHLPAFKFFTDTIRIWHERICAKKEKPAVVVAGTGIPDELLRAAGAVPLYIDRKSVV